MKSTKAFDIFIPLAEKSFERSGQGWRFKPPLMAGEWHLTEEQKATARFQVTQLFFFVCVEAVAVVVLLFTATMVTLEAGNPLEPFGLPLHVIALAPFLGVGLFFAQYRFRTARLLKDARRIDSGTIS
jgi:ABC-type transport system involved in cytochrome bd biosynthesis fused ATPase/permease subunit